LSCVQQLNFLAALSGGLLVVKRERNIARH
jgi:hypothetical protein